MLTFINKFDIMVKEREVIKMTKMIVFDMDGTIADLYGVDGWLENLRSENPRPYIMAEPLVDMDFLREVLQTLQTLGWRIAVTSWLAKGATKDYDEVVRQAKRDWLTRYNFPFDEIHLVKYGTTKANCTRNKADYQILIDDNEDVRKGWTLGDTLDATQDFVKELTKLLESEV